VLNNASNIVQIVGFPLALVGLLLAWREGRNSRDLQAALALADSFRSGWETNWRKALTTAEELTNKGEELPEEIREELRKMLNWLDWAGRLIYSGTLARPKNVLASIDPQLKRIIRVTAPIIKGDEERHDKEYWRGVRTLEKVFSTSGRRGHRIERGRRAGVSEG
jgi:hypothetical protein